MTRKRDRGSRGDMLALASQVVVLVTALVGLASVLLKLL